jgi:hypothetical protein
MSSRTKLKTSIKWIKWKQRRLSRENLTYCKHFKEAKKKGKERWEIKEEKLRMVYNQKCYDNINVLREIRRKSVWNKLTSYLDKVQSIN